MSRQHSGSLLLKLGIAVVAFAGVGWLFVRSLDDARAVPYEVRPAHLQGWTLQSVPDASGEQARLLLSPPPELPLRLFRQVFSRAGESLSTPARAGVALVLADELQGALVTDADLRELAEGAGLAGTAVTLECMGYRRESQPGRVRQVFFLVVNVPGFDTFRQRLSARLADGEARLRPLSPVMLLAGAPDVTGWMPIVVTPETDCVAPFALEE
jgi:hypothetical protein